ncbi:hypothetical protein L209DRAFT_434161 [Thermothelomyces heterothallicus CBS 203.75]
MPFWLFRAYSGGRPSHSRFPREGASPVGPATPHPFSPKNNWTLPILAEPSPLRCDQTTYHDVTRTIRRTTSLIIAITTSGFFFFWGKHKCLAYTSVLTFVPARYPNTAPDTAPNTEKQGSSPRLRSFHGLPRFHIPGGGEVSWIRPTSGALRFSSTSRLNRLWHFNTELSLLVPWFLHLVWEYCMSPLSAA